MVLFCFESQKLGILLENKAHLKSKLWKYANNKCWAPFFIFFNEKKNQKDSVDFWHRKITLKIRIALFLTFKTKKNHRPSIFIHTKLELRPSLFLPELSYAQLFKWGQANVLTVVGLLLTFSAHFDITLTHGLRSQELGLLLNFSVSVS